MGSQFNSDGKAMIPLRVFLLLLLSSLMLASCQSPLDIDTPRRRTVDKTFLSADTTGLTVALVLDASGSMAGEGLSNAKLASLDLLAQLDPSKDQASVVWFNNVVTIAQEMTSDTSALSTAVLSAMANGGTAVWDGMYAGLTEVIAHQRGLHTGVITLTDGEDNASFHFADEISALARQHFIPVYCIALGASTNTASLHAISEDTGGALYQTSDPQELASIFKTIATRLRSR